jgi:hypothetical protein
MKQSYNSDMIRSILYKIKLQERYDKVGIKLNKAIVAIR